MQTNRSLWSQIAERHRSEQQGKLPQTDRASAFQVNRVKTFLAFSSITVQNLFVGFHAVGAHVGGPKNLGDAGTPSLKMMGVVNP